MQLQLIRNATLKLQYAGQTILVDPMLSPKGAIQSFKGVERNPTVDLQMTPEEVLRGVDALLITHIHPDHFDPLAIEMADKNIPLFCQPADEAFMKEKGFVNVEVVHEQTVFEGINIIRTAAQHGSGEVLKYMGEVSGFVLQAEGEGKLYLVGDSIWYAEVEAAVATHQPDVIVTNSGGAMMPGHEATPILMEENDTCTIAKANPKAKIVAVHLEALDHCPVSRKGLREKLTAQGITANQLLIPKDGETLML